MESYTGMNYICVCHVYKLNTILLRAMKNREDTEMVISSKSCYTNLNTKGQHCTLHVLDNKCCSAVKEYITSEDTNLQFDQNKEEEREEPGSIEEIMEGVSNAVHRANTDRQAAQYPPNQANSGPK